MPSKSRTRAIPPEVPLCPLCRARLELGQTETFRLGEKRFVTCLDCAPIVKAGASAIGAGIHDHILPAVAGVAKKKAMDYLNAHPGLRGMLEGAFRGYEQAVRGQPPGRRDE